MVCYSYNFFRPTVLLSLVFHLQVTLEQSSSTFEVDYQILSTWSKTCYLRLPAIGIHRRAPNLQACNEQMIQKLYIWVSQRYLCLCYTSTYTDPWSYRLLLQFLIIVHGQKTCTDGAISNTS